VGGTSAGEGLIADRYRLVRPLGEGAAGRVYVAKDEARATEVALKLLSRSGLTHERADRFRHEFALLSTLSHPNLAHAYDFGRSGGGYFYTSELVRGEPIGAWFGTRRSAGEATRVAAEVLAGLDHLHRQGLAHGDVRSDNVLCADGGVKLIDFGLSQSGTPKDDLSRFGRVFEEAIGPVLVTDRRLAELVERLKTDVPGRAFPDAVTALAFLGVSPGAQPVFVGRDAELRRVRAATVAFVHGEEGCGKSALVERLKIAAQLDGVVAGVARPGDRPLGSIASLFRELGMDPRPLTRTYADGVGLKAAVTESLIRAARDHRVLLVFEDAHALDADSFALAAHLAEALPLAEGANAQVVVTWRDAEMASGRRAAEIARVPAEDVRLGPLDVGAVAGARLGGVASAELGLALARATEGNGTLLDALLRDATAFVERDGAWHAARELSVRVAGGEFGSLGDDAREVARLLAASPGPVARRTLERFLAPAKLDLALVELIRAGWVRPGGEARWAIASAIRRRAVPEAETRERHARLGDALASFGGKPDIETLGALTHHLLAAGEGARARTFGRRFAVACRRRYAFARAAEVFERCAEGAPEAEALELLESARGAWQSAANYPRMVEAAGRAVSIARTGATVHALAESLQAQGNLPEALEAYAAAAGLHEDAERAAEARVEMALIHGARREKKELAESLESAGVPPLASARVVTKVEIARAIAGFLDLDVERVIRHVKGATAAAARQKDARLRWRAWHTGLYISSFANPRYFEAERYLGNAIAIAHRARLTIEEVFSRAVLATLGEIRGKMLHARRAKQEMAETLLAAGEWSRLAHACTNLASTDLDLGDGVRADRASRQGAMIARRGSDKAVCLRALAWQAMAGAMRHDFDSTAQVLREVKELSGQCQDPQAKHMVARAEQFIRWEISGEVSAELVALLRHLVRSNAPIDASPLAVMAAASGGSQSSEIESALQCLRFWPNAIAEARLQCAMAYALSRSGDLPGAIRALARASRLAPDFHGLEALDIHRHLLGARLAENSTRALDSATKAYHGALRRGRLRLAEEAAELIGEIAAKCDNLERARHWYREAARLLDLRKRHTLEDANMSSHFERRRASLDEKRRETQDAGPERGWLRRVIDLDRALMSSQDMPKILSHVLDAMIEITGAERGYVLLAEGGELRTAASRNFDKADLKSADFRVSRTIAERAMRRQKPWICADAQQDEEIRDAASVREGRLRSLLCMPLMCGERAVGLVYLDNRHAGGVFETVDLSVLELYADRAALAVMAAQRLANAQRERRDRASIAASASSAPTGSGRAAKRSRMTRHPAFAALVGDSDALAEAIDLLQKAAAVNLPVLILGETGTGKELAARGLHHASPRTKAPFVAINCATLPGEVLESELFGHVRGAFTGAVRDKAGLFEAADGGTLFLDEIGEIPLKIQAKLLRALQDGEVRRVGATTPVRVNVRVVAASNRDLQRMVKQGEFREDLFYRLKRLVVVMPSLRSRKDDIPALVHHVLARQKPPREIAPGAAARLVDYGWPGNVRELEGVIESCAVMCDGTIDRALVESQLHLPSTVESDSLDMKANVQQTERALVSRALETSKNIRHAARRLGIARAQLYRMMERYSLHPKLR